MLRSQSKQASFHYSLYNKIPERLMKHLARNIIQTDKEETEEELESLPVVPAYKKISDHKQANRS